MPKHPPDMARGLTNKIHKAIFSKPPPRAAKFYSFLSAHVHQGSDEIRISAAVNRFAAIKRIEPIMQAHGYTSTWNFGPKHRRIIFKKKTHSPVP
ncbi:MAG TPA: hypothetical protein VJG83_04760 [archaeon]|nr:hypothetical protein [archaeon]